MKLKDLIESSNTGLDAIRRAPIVEYDTGIRCLRIGDISNNRPFNEWGYTEVEDNNYNKFQLKKGDIIVARTGATIGVNKYIDKEYKSVYNNGLIRIRVKKENNPRYVYYLLQSNNYKDFIKTISMGTSTQPNMQMNDLLNLEVPNFDRDKQDKIVNLLGSIDKKIELNYEINNKLRELCKNNYLGLIEKNCYKVSLSELMDYQGGSQPPASEFQKEKHEDNIRFVQIRDFEKDSYVCYIPNSTKNKLCNKDDILIARYGASLGRICYGLSGAYNVALAKVIPKKEEYKELLRVILESDDFYNYINQVGQRSAQAGFNAGDIAGYTAIIPDENGLKEFNGISKSVIDKRLLIVEENRKLLELRDTLLPKLMNSEINLDNIAI